MSTLNQIYYSAPGKLIATKDETSEFIISGYRINADPLLNLNTNLVAVPSSTGDFGVKGTMAFDKSHFYICIDNNKWARTRLAFWEEDVPISTEGLVIPTPTNWWNFTSNGNDLIGAYSFITNGNVTFDSIEGFKNPTSNTSLLNYSSNLIEPSVLNRDFSISFEVKRVGNGFLLGNPYGRLGFHFRFVDPTTENAVGGFTTAGTYLAFSWSTHTDNYNSTLGPTASLTNLDGPGARWTSLKSLNPINDSAYTQVLVTNNAFTRELKMYINGTLNDTKSYLTQSPLPRIRAGINILKGFGIGATIAGGTWGRPVDQIDYYNSSNIRYLGFWRNTVLNQENVTYLYNGGSFRRYPFV